MRHAQFLIEFHGALQHSPYGMPRCPWRKGKQWPLRPGGIIEPHAKPTGGDGGGVPKGHLPKGRRIKTGPPGSARGICINAMHPGRCLCGRHYLVNS